MVALGLSPFIVFGPGLGYRRHLRDLRDGMLRQVRAHALGAQRLTETETLPEVLVGGHAWAAACR